LTNNNFTVSAISPLDVVIPGTSALIQGTLELDSTSPISANVINTQIVAGRPNLSATEQCTGSQENMVLMFDDRNSLGNSTSLAVWNLSSSPATIYVNIQPSGASSSPQTITLQPNDHQAFTASAEWPAAANSFGTIQLYSPTPFAAVAYTFSSSGNFWGAGPIHSFLNPPANAPVNVTGVWSSLGGAGNSGYFVTNLAQTGSSFAGEYDFYMISSGNAFSGALSGTVSGNVISIAGSHSISPTSGCGITINPNTAMLSNNLLALNLAGVYDSTAACGPLSGSTWGMQLLAKPGFNVWVGAYTSPTSSGTFEATENADGTVIGAVLPSTGAAASAATFTGTVNGNTLTFTTTTAQSGTFTGVLQDGVLSGNLPGGGSFAATTKWN
jgi:hypothetical protein